MKENEKYWLKLYQDGKIEIDFENGIVYSYLSGKKNILGEKTKQNKEGKNFYLRSSAGISRQDRNHILLHRLIWIIANGDIPPKIEINHKNGIKYDNRLENLELTDKSGNALHSRRVLGNKGGIPKSNGENNAMAKLTWEDVDAIRLLYNSGVSRQDIAKQFNSTSSGNLYYVIKNKTWMKR
jgi:hypothetical protein